ncbi:hypothetical protein E4U10_004493 [Claviceps purpurea]|nr:hypothetical protein E4U10_004493 [Claviceps purpurea]
MSYVEGITPLDDTVITAADKELIENWTTGLGKNIQQRCDRCNCICKGCREADELRRNPGPGQRGPGTPEL